MDARNNIATDLFYKIRSRFSGLKLGAETGQITINPEEARFFDFDYMEGEQPIGHVSISLAEPNSMKVYFSHGITEAMDSTQKDHWYGFLKELRKFAKRRLLNFDTRDISKDNLDKRDYAFLSQYSNPKPTTDNAVQKPVGESIMSESAMYGTKTVSYQKLENTRLIIKHSQAVMDDAAPGARSRNISGLFVENADGERFKYPFIHLSGARAMQRHVANGGKPYDQIGESIIKMSEEIAQLKSFGAYVVRNDLMNSDTNNVVERSTQQLNRLRETVSKLSKQGYYEAYKESFQIQPQMEVPQDVVEQFTDQFTVKNFKEDIASVFPVLYRLMQEDNTVGYDDIVAMTQQEELEEDAEITAADPFAAFEEWAMNLGEASAITSSDPEEQQAALRELQELVSQEFPVGVDASNAIESLKGIIEDAGLFNDFKAVAKDDPNTDARVMVKTWVEENAPEALEGLDFGDMVDRAAEYDDATDTAPQEAQEGDDEDPPFDPDEPKKDGNKDQFGNEIKDKNRAKHLAKKGLNQQLNVQELAEFIHTFYDRASGTFPKGPEGVAILVGKKFGEQAETVARHMVERMAPYQKSADHTLGEFDEAQGQDHVNRDEKLKRMGAKDLSTLDKIKLMPRQAKAMARGDSEDDLVNYNKSKASVKESDLLAIKRLAGLK
jgi:hypothetical protein